MKAVVLLSGGIDSTACVKFYLDLSYDNRMKNQDCKYIVASSSERVYCSIIIDFISSLP